MQSVFVAGSRAELPARFVERLRDLVEAGLEVLVGDASTGDRAIQEVLLEDEATEVTVFCTGWHPKNNLGRWPSQIVSSRAKPGTRISSIARDVTMASSADLGLLLWDARSIAILSNVVELTRQGKSSVVFIDRDDAFFVVKDVSGLRKLIDLMSDAARIDAEEKLGLSSQLEAMAQQSP